MFGINFLKDVLITSTNLVRKRILFFSLFAVSVKTQLDNPFLTVLNPINTSELLLPLIPTTVQQTNNGHVWFGGGAVSSLSTVNGECLFSEIENGTLLSTITFGGSGDQIVSDFIQHNDSLIFTGRGNAFVGSSNVRAFIGEFATNSKTLSWLTVFGTNGPSNIDFGNCIVARNGSGYVLGGQTNSFGNGGIDGTIVAVANNGTIECSNTVGESGDEYITDLINTNDGGYAGVGTTNYNTAGGNDMSLYKFNNNCNLLWSKKFGGIEDDFAMSVVELTNGHLTVVGNTQSFGAVGKATVTVEFDNIGNLVSGVIVDGPGDEVVYTAEKSKLGIKFGGYTTSYGAANSKEMFIVDMYENNTLSRAITIGGSGNNIIYGMGTTQGGGYTFTGVYNQSAVVGKSDIYGELPSNCIKPVTPSVIDITANIMVSTPNITTVPFTPIIFNATFFLSSPSLVTNKLCAPVLNNPFLTVVNPTDISNSVIIPLAVKRANDSHLWSVGTGIFGPALDEDLLFLEVVNGKPVSSIRVGGVGHDVVSDFIPVNDNIVFTGWSGPTLSTADYRAIIGNVATGSNTLSWLTVFGGTNLSLANIGRSIVPRNGGGYTLSGKTNSFGAGGYDGMIAEFDNNGNRLCSSTIGETGDETFPYIIKTNDGGYAGVGTTTSFTAGAYDMSLYKFNNNCNLLWSKKFGGMGDDFAKSVVELTNGYLKVVGTTQSFGAVGKAMVTVEFDSAGNLLSGEMIDGPGDEEANVAQKTKLGIKLGGCITLGNSTKMFIVDMYDNNTLSKAIQIDGSGNDVIYAMSATQDGGYVFTGTYGRGASVAKSDIYGEFPSNCTTPVTPSVIDITANITVSTPNITAVPFTPTIFNVTFTQKSAPIVAENPCVFTTPPAASVPTLIPTLTPTPVPTVSSMLSGSTLASTTLVTSISSGVASISTPSSSTSGLSTISSVMQTSNPITFNVIATTNPIVIESGTPTTLSINAFSFTGNVNPEQLVYTVLGNNPNVVITVNGIITNTFTQSDVEGQFVSIALDGVTCGYSGNLQFDVSVAGSSAPSQQVNVPLLFDGTTCTTANTGRLLVFSRKQAPRQEARPMESFELVARFKY